MFDWLPDFALNYTERESFTSETGVQQLRRAAHTVYATDKYGRRGEFGELLLHMVLREHFGTEPAVSKLYYKDGANETVKGFDAVHVVNSKDGIELWLGEVKFYADLKSAIRDVTAELVAHFEEPYLRAEFGAVTNKIDPTWPHAKELRELLHPRVSLDELRPAVRVPALVTYDSGLLSAHDAHSSEYSDALASEAKEAWAAFTDRALPADITIHLLLVPLREKKLLVDELHKRLKTWQAM